MTCFNQLKHNYASLKFVDDIVSWQNILMGQSRHISIQMTNILSIICNINCKKCICCAWYSNPGPQDIRRWRFHWAFAGNLCHSIFTALLYLTFIRTFMHHLKLIKLGVPFVAFKVFYPTTSQDISLNLSSLYTYLQTIVYATLPNKELLRNHSRKSLLMLPTNLPT